MKAPVHPDIPFYLDAQAMVYLVLALMLLTFLLTIVVLPYKRRRPQDIVFVLLGLFVVAFGAFVVLSSWVLVSRDGVTLGDTEMRVGDQRLALSGDVELLLPKTPPDVEPGEQGYFHLPSSGGRALPFFNGGPAMLVRAGGNELRVFPVMYGPAAYFGANASKEATELFRSLASRAKPGEARTWLEAIYTPFDGDAKKTTPSRTALFVVGGLIAALILGFLIAIQVAVRRKRRADGKDPTS